MQKEEAKIHLVNISNKIHELEHKLLQKKQFYRETLKTLEGRDYSEVFEEALDVYKKLESAICFAKEEFAKYQKKYKNLFV